MERLGDLRGNRLGLGRGTRWGRREEPCEGEGRREDRDRVLFHLSLLLPSRCNSPAREHDPPATITRIVLPFILQPRLSRPSAGLPRSRRRWRRPPPRPHPPSCVRTLPRRGRRLRAGPCPRAAPAHRAAPLAAPR